MTELRNINIFSQRKSFKPISTQNILHFTKLVSYTSVSAIPVTFHNSPYSEKPGWWQWWRQLDMWHIRPVVRNILSFEGKWSLVVASGLNSEHYCWAAADMGKLHRIQRWESWSRLQSLGRCGSQLWGENVWDQFTHLRRWKWFTSCMFIAVVTAMVQVDFAQISSLTAELLDSSAHLNIS